MRILKPGLIVSCQAERDSPFNAPEFIVAFAKAVEMGGAVAVRIRDIENIKAVRHAVRVPIIGITKSTYPNGDVLITPTLDDIERILQAGADIVAIDVTDRLRPTGERGVEFLRAARKRFEAPLMADIATLPEGLAAASAGADFVGTTLSGYTEETRQLNTGEPDSELVRKLSTELPGKVIAEGRVWSPEQARKMMQLGAYAVVVGTAITRPIDIVRRFASSLHHPES